MSVKYLIICILIVFLLLIGNFPSSHFISDEDAIDSAYTEIDDANVHLNIRLNKDITCASAIKALGVESFYVEEELYKPYCTKPKPLLIRITFKKSVSI